MKYDIIFCGEKVDINNKPRIWGIISLYDDNGYVFFGTPKTLMFKDIAPIFKYVVWTYHRIEEKKRFYQEVDNNYIFEKFPEIKTNIEQFILMEMLK